MQLGVLPCNGGVVVGRDGPAQRASEGHGRELACLLDGFGLGAALRGQRLWAVYPGETTTASEYYTGTYGRLRDVVPGPDGTAWVLTSNTDGRGSPVSGDDRLLQIDLVPLG